MNIAVVLAAGKGTRMQAGVNKQFIYLGDKPVLAYTLEAFDNCPAIDEIVLVIAKEDIDICKQEVLGKYHFNKLNRTVFGGTERQGSVYNALAELQENGNAIVLIHDGARPFIDCSTISICINGAEQYGAVTIGVPIKETIKLVDADGFITETPSREHVWVTQTPQAFRLELIKQAHKSAKEANYSATDDAMLVERIGHKVKMLQGSYENLKITTPEDKITAEELLKIRQDRTK